MTECIGEYIVSLTAKTFTDLRSYRHEEIVRCRDCDNAAHFYQWLTPSKRSSIETWTCRNMEGLEIDPDGFCAWGERKDVTE